MSKRKTFNTSDVDALIKDMDKVIQNFQQEHEVDEEEISQFLTKAGRHQDRIGELFTQDFSKSNAEKIATVKGQIPSNNVDKGQSQEEKPKEQEPSTSATMKQF